MATVIGNDGANWLSGTGTADTLKGFGGNDTLKGGGGADYLYGGTGIDTALYADSPEGVWVDLRNGYGMFGTAQGDRLSSIENVHGSAYGDTLIGNDGANAFYGLDGSDGLEGEGGADYLDGGYGNDSLNGGAGADVLIGGPGTDTGWYERSPAGVNVSLTTGFGYGGDADGDTLYSVENLYGSQFSDLLYGDAAANILDGNFGDDTILGYAGDDDLSGSWGRDNLYGGEGDDDLNGGPDADVLHGGSGRDIIRGDTGADDFVWSSTDDTGVTRLTADIVADFNFAEGDRIYLSAIDADVYAAGDQAFRFIGAAAFSGTPGEINYYHADGHTYIQMQTGTSPDVEGVIRLSGIVTPQADWFVL